MPLKLYAIALVVAGLIALVCFTIISCNRTKLAERREHRREERSHKMATCNVTQVIGGGMIEVEWTRRKTREVLLAGIEVPVECESQASDNLDRLVSSTAVTLLYESRRVFGDSADASHSSEIESAGEVFETSGPISAIVYDAGHRCLQVEQLAAGLARCNGEANDEMKAAEKSAKKAKRGIWQ
jgi:endonuclease YncB( thermonuclease family)